MLPFCWRGPRPHFASRLSASSSHPRPCSARREIQEADGARLYYAARTADAPGDRTTPASSQASPPAAPADGPLSPRSSSGSAATAGASSAVAPPTAKPVPVPSAAGMAGSASKPSYWPKFGPSGAAAAKPFTPPRTAGGENTGAPDKSSGKERPRPRAKSLLRLSPMPRKKPFTPPRQGGAAAVGRHDAHPATGGGQDSAERSSAVSDTPPTRMSVVELDTELAELRKECVWGRGEEERRCGRRGETGAVWA